MKSNALSEFLNYATVRIECTDANGNISCGTGFFYKFNKQPDGSCCTVIITNKHVVKNSVSAKIHLTHRDTEGNPIDGKYTAINFNAEFETFESRWHMHPDPTVDLCAMGTTDVSSLFEKKYGTRFMSVSLEREHLPTQAEIDSLLSTENVFMIGYPNGIWDSKNNRPIFRRGILATHPKFDYNGNKEFLIDIACYPGSSGSPIIAIKEKLYLNNNHEVVKIQNKILLLGINYAVFLQKPNMEIEIINIPTASFPISTFKIPINLALVIKSERILELEKYFINGK